MGNPRLVAVSGPLAGTVWLVEHGPMFLGRDPSNQVELKDVVVSRKHCSVTATSQGAFEIADLDSHNGTFVNGNKVTQKAIEHGDRIRVGKSDFVFLTGPDDGYGSAAGPGSLRSDSDLKTMRLDNLGLPRDASGIGRMAQDLSAFFKIANVINSTRDVQSLQGDLLALIGEVIPAAQGAMLLQLNRDEEPDPPRTWNRKGDAGQKIQIREEIVQQAAWERSAVLAVAQAGSTSSEHVLCVPLLAIERALGVIYLSSPGSKPPFNEQHAYFLSSVSRIIAVTLENLLKLDSLREENRRLRGEDKTGNILVGESRAMLRVNDFIRRVSKGDSTVLIRGESGTGKELIARALHTNSLRCEKPFIAINCAAIPESLLESELFGHEKGAFTGAATTRKGKFEAAEDGTVFLDEVGEMAPSLQVKLLRVLQQREFERLGGNRLLPFNARVVAATNKNLELAIKAGEFRQDLYYRLNVVSVVSPALRERREDIPSLVLHFANKYSAKCGRGFKGITAGARSLLMQYSWPGNVRELENAVEHAIVMGLTNEILPEDLPAILLEEQSAELAGRYHNTLNQTKKQLVLAALGEANGSPVEAARLLGIHPKYLHRLIRNLNLRSDMRAMD
ncbi:MAG: sigma 54-interacting transcriptional regulator [Acidobacteriaceae bacterium]